jgi:D-alanyl-D-alanine carboxypeptidase
MHMHEQLLRRGVATLVAALATALALCVGVPTASADAGPPSIIALHAFVGDPLFGLDTPAATLFGTKPDEQTAMASTTKVWTLDLTVHALNQGLVHLDDLVTINQYESSLGKGNSLMTDVNGKSLEAGEVVKLRDLLRGLIYQSGNDAAFAIGRHVAKAYYGPAADDYSFVQLMNDHAAALGQSNTHFTNPPGWDNAAHYTTARELAEEFQHALQDPYFKKVVGFTGTYTAMTQGPNGPKTYTMNWGRPYPGWDGEKGGSTPNCVGPYNFCIAVAATRISRRVVATGMQIGSNSDVTGMLDYGFDQIFHPDPRGTSAGAGLVSRHALDCFGANRAITANLPPSGPVTLGVWYANVDGSTLTKLAGASVPASDAQRHTGDVAVTRLPSGDIILALRMGSAVQLSRWTINRMGTLTLLASGIAAGNATTMSLQPVYGDGFLLALTDPNGDFVVKSWRLQGTGLALLDTYTDHEWNTIFTEVAAAGPVTADVFSGHRAVTAVRDSKAYLRMDVWGVDQATGKLTRLGFNNVSSHVDPGFTLTPLFVTPNFDGELPPPYYALAWRDGDYGDLNVQFRRIDGSGDPVNESVFYSIPLLKGTGAGTRIRLAPLGTGGLMSAITDVAGNTQLIAWEARRDDGAISPSQVNKMSVAQVSEHDAPAANSLSLCRLPGSVHAEGDYVTATKDPDGSLRLRAYRSGDRPYGPSPGARL